MTPSDLSAPSEFLMHATHTFKAVSEEWLKPHKAGWSAHHHERNEGLLRRILWPDLGDLPIHEITEPMLLKPLLI
jgi:hypothetical protein